MKKLTRQELTERVAVLERMVYQQQQTIKVMDAGIFLALYSLLHENKVFTPDFIKTSDDIVGTGVSEAISKMLEIIDRVEGNNGTAQGQSEQQTTKSKSD